MLKNQAFASNLIEQKVQFLAGMSIANIVNNKCAGVFIIAQIGKLLSLRVESVAFD